MVNARIMVAPVSINSLIPHRKRVTLEFLSPARLLLRLRSMLISLNTSNFFRKIIMRTLAAALFILSSSAVLLAADDKDKLDEKFLVGKWTMKSLLNGK